MNANFIQIYDTTMRDGAQGEGISFSTADKLMIASRLDELGVSYVEGGWPASNPKDDAFFKEAARLKLKRARLTAFGSTCKVDVSADKDASLTALSECSAPVTAIFGKSWLLHVSEVLKTTPERNLEMIKTSCGFLAKAGKEVVFDAEHFFDGYADNEEYALAVIDAAVAGGASTVTLCDTNGGTMPVVVRAVCEKVRARLPENVVLGIHCHNDSDLAVANSIMAVRGGARLVQGTINGFGERSGNANLCSIIPNLELKTEYRCLPDGHLKLLHDVSVYIDDMANVRHDPRRPFVGDSAFAHKGGMHVDAVRKNPKTFEQIDPELVGNRRRILVSDLSGRSNLLLKAKEMGFELEGGKLSEMLRVIKEKENLGYEYESADASFSVLMHKIMKRWNHYFTLEGFRVIVEKRKTDDGQAISEATVKLSVNGVTRITAAEGDGPVNALDIALRKSLVIFYPEISKVFLTDFKVRIIEGNAATAAKTRVFIESSDGKEFWNTVGCGENIIQASWEALVDSMEYWLFKNKTISVIPD